MDKVSFENQVVIVTGSGSGFGRTYALEIARRGGAVVVNDLGTAVEGVGRSQTAANKVVEEIVAAGGRAVASFDDVGSSAGAKRIVETAFDHFGCLDSVINNAGNLRIDWFEDVSDEDLQSQINTHLLGTYYVTRAAWPHLQKQRYGRVVFTTSGAGMMGHPAISAYGAAKGGVTGLMNVLAQEGARHGILCNAIHPNSFGRMAEKMGESLDPEELAKMTPLNSVLGSAMQPEFTTAMTVYLASNACKTTRAIYSSLGGRFSRIFIGVTKGWQGSREVPSTADDVAAHFDQICNEEHGYYVPSNLMDEFRLMLELEGA